MFSCQECGRKFGFAKAAYRASNYGCPMCRKIDIDLSTEGRRESNTDVPTLQLETEEIDHKAKLFEANERLAEQLGFERPDSMPAELDHKEIVPEKKSHRRHKATTK